MLYLCNSEEKAAGEKENIVIQHEAFLSSESIRHRYTKTRAYQGPQGQACDDKGPHDRKTKATQICPIVIVIGLINKVLQNRLRIIENCQLIAHGNHG